MRSSIKFGRMPVLGGLEVRIGPKSCPAAVTVPGSASDGAYIHTG
jgi:hypothetical protein